MFTFVSFSFRVQSRVLRSDRSAFVSQSTHVPFPSSRSAGFTTWSFLVRHDPNGPDTVLHGIRPAPSPAFPPGSERTHPEAAQRSRLQPQVPKRAEPTPLTPLTPTHSDSRPHTHTLGQWHSHPHTLTLGQSHSHPHPHTRTLALTPKRIRTRPKGEGPPMFRPCSRRRRCGVRGGRGAWESARRGRGCRRRATGRDRTWRGA